jgi:phage FluMu protein Com
MSNERMTPLVEARCSACGRRLLDFSNDVKSGQVMIQKICERCKTVNVVTISAE